MQNKSFIFWLFNKDYKALYEDTIIREADANNLKPNGQPAHLEYAPDGWKDTLVKYGRNIKWLGVFRTFTAPMNFKKDGAQIVKDAMWKLGMEAILYLAINKLNRTVYPPKYEPWYVGELDFSKFDQKKANVILNVMEGGLSKYLKAFENTTYQIDIDADPEAELVVMDGIPFTNKVEYSIFDNPTYYASDSKFYNIGAGTISQEGSTQGILAMDQQAEAFNQEAPFLKDYSKFVTPVVSGNISIKVIENHNIEIFIRKRNLETGIDTDYSILNAAPGVGSFNYPFSFSIPITPNDNLYLLVKTYNGVGSIYFIISGGSLFINYEVTFDQTIIKALKPLRLLQKVVEKMTDGRYTASSNYLSSMTDLLITSGSAIRNHEGQSPPVTGSIFKTSLDEFFRALKIRGIGLGIENDVLVIEKTSYFFKSDVAIALGEVSEFEVTVAEDMEFNTIKVGYANQTYDNVNGLDEFNVTQIYTTPHTRIVKELDLTSPYRADAYGIELMRLNLSGKDTTDNSADNDTFFLNTKKGGTYNYYSGNLSYNTNGANTITIPSVLNAMNGESITLAGAINSGVFVVTNSSYLIVGSTILTVAGTLIDGTENALITATSSILNMLNRPSYSAITGVLHPAKIFNVELSPKRVVLNNSDFLHSLLDYQDANFIKFQSGDKNSELSTTLAGVTITEKADIQIAQLAPKLFKPYYFTFKVPTDYNFLKTIAASPYSKLSFTVEDKIYYGYLVDGGVKPATRDVQQMKLLCAPETNLSQLIDLI